VTVAPLVIPFPQIGPATIKLNMHMYRASRCQFDAVGNPTRFVYSIKRQAEMQTFNLKHFRMLTEGCVYDRFNYEIYGLSAGALLEDPPGFVKEEASMLRFNVSTNDLMSIGSYDLVL
jgi:hypothetical protein